MAKMEKQPIRQFMQVHYTDQRLADLLCHARDGKLNYYSCCCFIGVATADHPLRTELEAMGDHYDDAEDLSGALEAEGAFCDLTISPNGAKDDDERGRRILIPMIRAEMWRRAKLRKVTMAAELNQPASQAAEPEWNKNDENWPHREEWESPESLEQDVAK